MYGPIQFSPAWSFGGKSKPKLEEKPGPGQY